MNKVLNYLNKNEPSHSSRAGNSTHCELTTNDCFICFPWTAKIPRRVLFFFSPPRANEEKKNSRPITLSHISNVLCVPCMSLSAQVQFLLERDQGRRRPPIRVISTNARGFLPSTKKEEEGRKGKE